MRDLRDVLAEHGGVRFVPFGPDTREWKCSCEATLAGDVSREDLRDAHAEHLAAVVREWATSDEAVTVVSAALYDHGPSGGLGMPRDEHDCCAETALAALFGGDPHA